MIIQTNSYFYQNKTNNRFITKKIIDINQIYKITAFIIWFYRTINPYPKCIKSAKQFLFHVDNLISYGAGINNKNCAKIVYGMC